MGMKAGPRGRGAERVGCMKRSNLRIRKLRKTNLWSTTRATKCAGLGLLSSPRVGFETPDGAMKMMKDAREGRR
jgi:hypothetical protein